MTHATWNLRRKNAETLELLEENVPNGFYNGKFLKLGELYFTEDNNPDAALVATAPELLEAAEDLMEWFDMGRAVAPSWEEVRLLRDAIAKAKGQS